MQNSTFQVVVAVRFSFPPIALLHWGLIIFNPSDKQAGIAFISPTLHGGETVSNFFFQNILLVIAQCPVEIGYF
jgi:hypothetical protein